MVRFTGEPISIIQGPNSDKVKYKKSLCHNCNCIHSKEWDIAYDVFVDWCWENSKANEINFAEMYDKNYTENLKNLHCYFAKSLGCKIIDSKVELPDNFPNLFI